MVGRLVQKEKVGLAVNELAETYLGLLAAGENLHETFDMLGGKSAFGKGRPNLVLGHRRKFIPDFLDTGNVGIVFLCLLEVTGL